MESTTRIRCAIYTRKSTDEGLDQEFNTLDAQRESAEAFIKSQQHEGWVALPDRYDDGGFTGGNIERPALKRLLADVTAGKVDCIVVYKVDRLSRSLLDFSRIMDTLEQNGARFVSVTQQFNTTHSMGRLTLNILLSFAQFEREIIAERTRDKMSAARRKGKWVGGMLVLGYDVDPRGGRLIVNEDEAARVREIFDLYLRERALLPTVQELARRGWTIKRWTTRKGAVRGGSPFNKTNLFRLLTNPVYVGRIDYKGTIYEGEHDAIVSEDVFARVRTILRENRRNGGRDVRNRYGALLKGLLYCGKCNASMVHAYTSQRGKRYRYYVCSHAQKNGWDTCLVKSLPAPDIERFVVERIRAIGNDSGLVGEVIRKAQEQSSHDIESLERERRILETELRALDGEIRKLLQSKEINSTALRTARLADLQDRVRETERRATNVREEMLKMEGERIDGDQITTALSRFDPMWDALLPKERVRIMQLLIERVVYRGEGHKVAVSFRPAGIRSLAVEADSV